MNPYLMCLQIHGLQIRQELQFYFIRSWDNWSASSAVLTITGQSCSSSKNAYLQGNLQAAGPSGGRWPGGREEKNRDKTRDSLFSLSLFLSIISFILSHPPLNLKPEDLQSSISPSSLTQIHQSTSQIHPHNILFNLHQTIFTLTHSPQKIQFPPKISSTQKSSTMGYRPKRTCTGASRRQEEASTSRAPPPPQFAPDPAFPDMVLVSEEQKTRIAHLKLRKDYLVRNWSFWTCFMTIWATTRSRGSSGRLLSTCGSLRCSWLSPGS
ncbi:uncharacterized protein [Spinacia oleracea]|uniref:Uncharacterized protein isoform X2 n=2 Tax=Spinacia oleracea TaxID=3562 RepID=A0ABM3QS76_SPIOL|nr:uncharacterized protein LOC110778331 isoform X2 [Spinacia oleracea]XP_056686222.1 uncharacterized protein LOC110778331 isoform X2 [Spinacia oleracea]XP_056686223.1 uncharacterized protein LOC110778331 isoform X2 [Spinacia oleracea]